MEKYIFSTCVMGYNSQIITLLCSVHGVTKLSMPENNIARQSFPGERSKPHDS